MIARFDTPARRNLGAAGLAWFLLLAGAVTALWVFAPIRRDALDSDLTLVYIGARIGLEHGWSQIYSLDLQHQLFAQLRPGVPFGDGQRARPDRQHAATYSHLQDFAILVIAAWLFWRGNPPASQRLWLLVVGAAGELAWPLSPLPILVAVAVWLEFLIVPSPPPARRGEVRPRPRSGLHRGGAPTSEAQPAQ